MANNIPPYAIPTMTKKSLRKICIEDKGYSTPKLNDVIYLHHKGFRQIENLDEYTGLRCIWLQNNVINSLKGLQSQENLRVLYMHNNILSTLDGIQTLINLVTINVSHNTISKIQFLSSLPHLQTLYISHNRIKASEDFCHLASCRNLSCADLSYNQIESPNFIQVLGGIEQLRVIQLMGNPAIRTLKGYRNKMIFQCPNLTYLDERPVFPVDKEAAAAWFEGGIEAERYIRREWVEKENMKMRENVLAVLNLKKRQSSYSDNDMGMLVQDNGQEKVYALSEKAKQNAIHLIASANLAKVADNKDAKFPSQLKTGIFPEEEWQTSKILEANSECGVKEISADETWSTKLGNDKKNLDENTTDTFSKPSLVDTPDPLSVNGCMPDIVKNKGLNQCDQSFLLRRTSSESIDMESSSSERNTQTDVSTDDDWDPEYLKSCQDFLRSVELQSSEEESYTINNSMESRSNKESQPILDSEVFIDYQAMLAEVATENTYNRSTNKPVNGPMPNTGSDPKLDNDNICKSSMSVSTNTEASHKSTNYVNSNQQNQKIIVSEIPNNIKSTFDKDNSIDVISLSQEDTSPRRVDRCTKAFMIDQNSQDSIETKGDSVQSTSDAQRLKQNKTAVTKSDPTLLPSSSSVVSNDLGNNYDMEICSSPNKQVIPSKEFNTTRDSVTLSDSNFSSDKFMMTFNISKKSSICALKDSHDDFISGKSIGAKRNNAKENSAGNKQKSSELLIEEID